MPAMIEWVGYTDKVIALRRAGKADGALYESLQGKRRMDALREQISEFQGVEAGLRVQRIRTAHLRWTWMVTSCVGLGLGFAVFLALFTRYHIERLGTKLLQSEERWTATLGSIGDAVIATDSEARVTFLNSVAAALTGWQSEEALNQPLQDVFKIINEQTGEDADDEVLRVLEERQILTVTNHVALIARDGREIPVEHSAAPILAGEGKVIGVVLVFRDVAERRREQDSDRRAGRSARTHTGLRLRDRHGWDDPFLEPWGGGDVGILQEPRPPAKSRTTCFAPNFRSRWMRSRRNSCAWDTGREISLRRPRTAGVLWWPVAGHCSGASATNRLACW